MGYTSPPMNPEVLAQMVQQNDEKHEEGHHRLRLDFRSLEARVLSLEACRTANDVRVTQLANAPVDVTRWSARLPTIAAIVVGTVAIVGSNWYVGSGVSAEMVGLKAQLAAQAQLENERASNLKDAIAHAEKMQEMQRVQLESLTKTVLSQRR